MIIHCDTTRFIYEVLENQEYKFLFDGLNVLDLGCNIGTFSLWIYPHANRIWAVDDKQENIDLFNKTIKDNEMKSVNTYTERVLNLQEFMQGHSIRDVDVLKIDVEGDEYEILNNPFPEIPTIIGEHHNGSLGDILTKKGYRYQDLQNGNNYNHFIARK